MKRIVLISILLVLFTCFNCSEVKSEIMYVKKLKATISKTFDLKEVRVKMTNNDDLKIELKNSKFNDFSPREKREVAKQIGIMAMENRDNMPRIKKGLLIFIDETDYLISKRSESTTYNLFIK